LPISSVCRRRLIEDSPSEYSIVLEDEDAKPTTTHEDSWNSSFSSHGSLKSIIKPSKFIVMHLGTQAKKPEAKKPEDLTPEGSLAAQVKEFDFEATRRLQSLFDQRISSPSAATARSSPSAATARSDPPSDQR
jgi:hypothetical protein